MFIHIFQPVQLVFYLDHHAQRRIDQQYVNIRPADIAAASAILRSVSLNCSRFSIKAAHTFSKPRVLPHSDALLRASS
jgi:hypothetical protein